VVGRFSSLVPVPGASRCPKLASSARVVAWNSSTRCRSVSETHRRPLSQAMSSTPAPKRDAALVLPSVPSKRSISAQSVPLRRSRTTVPFPAASSVLASCIASDRSEVVPSASR
jgi:hypothetical protein